MHQSHVPPIGFEGFFSERPKSVIGFEEFEIGNDDGMSSNYSPVHTMPVPPLPVASHMPFTDPRSDSSQSLPSLYTQSPHNNSDRSSIKLLSFRELFVIHEEIESWWCITSWLTFVDRRKEIYLTLTEISADRSYDIQMAIDQHYLTSGQNRLLNVPECLLIRTTPTTRTRFLPNAVLSLEQLFHSNSIQLPTYRLMSILCGSKENNNRIMFYKDSRSNRWYVYHHLSQFNSGILSDENQFLLKSIIQQNGNIDITELNLPLSALSFHPIVYVYRPAT